MKPRSTAVLIAALFCFFAGVTALWLKLDRAPPYWDDAWYLTNSLVLYDALADGGMSGFAREFVDILDFKAPLITALPAPFYLVFGRHWQAAYAVNICSMLLLFASVFWIGSRLRGPRAGFIAVFVTGTMPLLYGLSRWYLVEYALTALVAVSIGVLLLLADRFDRSWVSVCFGVLAGLGLLLKVTYPIFVLPSFLAVLSGAKHRSRIVFTAGIPCLLIAAPWYSRHWYRTVEFALSAGYGESGMVYGTGTIFSWQAVVT
jgi:4-amino-4-deoxy-L-arabinose transferase-like glycosyltransferase